MFIQHIFGEISVLSLGVLAWWEQGSSLGHRQSLLQRGAVYKAVCQQGHGTSCLSKWVKKTRRRKARGRGGFISVNFNNSKQ